MEKLITKSFQRLLDKGIHRGFITHEELSNSLGKRNSSQENFEKSFLYIFDNKVTLVEKKSDYQPIKKKESSSSSDEDDTTKVKPKGGVCLKDGYFDQFYYHILSFNSRISRISTTTKSHKYHIILNNPFSKPTVLSISTPEHIW